MPRLAPTLNADHYLDVLVLEKTPQQAIPFYKDLLKKADAKLAADFLEGFDVERLVRTRGWCVEQVLMQLWKQSIANEKLSLVAVGGFGRGDLHPYSDVDILILKATKSKRDDAQISCFVQSLWDVGLEVGASVRTAKECYEDAKEDVTIATNLMEARFILGQHSNFVKMQKLVSAKKIWKGEDFFIAKWQEQKQRHKKFSDTTYNVEPNIKEGPGGLRDIQMVSWVVQRFYQTESLHELVDNGFLTEYEYIRLKRGQNFLWKVRFALHLIAKRKEERVLFGYQLKLAKIFGFHDEGVKNPAVEQFMQIYYRNAMRLGRLNSRLLQLFDENILKENHQESIKNLNARFHIINDFLEIKETQLFSSQPSVWFELFLLLQKHPKIQGVRADTVRAMRHNISQINDDFRNNSEVKQQFIQILQQNHKVASVLNHMNRLGILARYLPVFGKIVGRMQFDLFHIYTVDQHSLFAVRNLCLLHHGKTSVKQAQEIFSHIPQPYLVYLGALFHDIAKGREGHHADLGAIDAAEFCQHHRINKEDTELVVWLVKEHLLMSETAQKKDLSDPDVIADFALQMGSLLRLRAMYLLTIADISATDPKLWNSFKESLLHELYLKTKHQLTLDKSDKSPLEQDDTVKEELALRLKQEHNSTDRIANLMENFPSDLYHKLTPEKLFKIHSSILNQKEPLVTELSRQQNSIEFLVYCHDFKGLFYMMVSILEKYNFNVLEASINNTSNAYALNTVHCLFENNSNQKMLAELTAALEQQKYYSISMDKYVPSREKLFKIKAQVKILQTQQQNNSLIEVICRDRHGLLSLIAKALLSLDISINAAKIMTVGARAENTFWLSIYNKPLNKKQLQQLQKTLVELL